MIIPRIIGKTIYIFLQLWVPTSPWKNKMQYGYLLFYWLFADCGAQARGSAGGEQSGHATRYPTSRTAGGDWPSRMLARPAGWMAVSSSASRQRASSGWWRGSSSSYRLQMETSGSACAGALSATGRGVPTQDAHRNTTGWMEARPSSGPYSDLTLHIVLFWPLWTKDVGTKAFGP